MIKFYLCCVAWLFLGMFSYGCSGHKENHPSDAGSSESVGPPADTTVKKNLSSFAIGAVIDDVTANSDPSQHFALYLPKSYNQARRLPALLLFDPHAGGTAVVRKYAGLADEFGFILAASNNSHNGLELDQTDQIAATLLQEILQRTKADSGRISYGGFSGGSKVALHAAKRNILIRNVIYAGAAMDLDQSTHSFPLLGFAGVDDMNYNDLLSFDQTITRTFQHYLIRWNGKHEWPDPTVYRKAFYWILFSDMKNQVIPIDEAWRQRYLQEPAPVPSTLLAPQWDYLQVMEKMAFLNGIVDVTDYGKQLALMSNTPGVKQALQAEKSQMIEEDHLKQSLWQDGFSQNRDLNWWKAKIDAIHSMPDAQTSHHLLGFISLNCYGAVDNLLRAGQLAKAQEALGIYGLADPQNPDQAYFMAVLSAKNNNAAEALQWLQTAKQRGFTEWSKAEAEPAFANIRSTGTYQALIH